MLTAFVGGRVFPGDGKAFEQGTVLVEGDPLEDIGLLLSAEAIRLVMQGGKLVKGEW